MAFMNKVLRTIVQGRARNTGVEFPSLYASVYRTVRMLSSPRVFVGGLSYVVDETSLRETFAPYGDVTEARIIVDRETGRSRGFGFVGYTSAEAASSAIQALDGKELNGRWMRVAYASERSGGVRYGSGGGGGWGSQDSSGGNYGAGGGGYGSYPTSDGGGGYGSYQTTDGGGGYGSYPTTNGGGYGSYPTSDSGSYGSHGSNNYTTPDGGGGSSYDHGNGGSSNNGGGSGGLGYGADHGGDEHKGVSVTTSEAGDNKYVEGRDDDDVPAPFLNSRSW